MGVVAILLPFLGIAATWDYEVEVPLPVAAPIYAVPSPHTQRNHWIAVYAERFDADPAWLRAVSLAENTRGLAQAWSWSRCCVGPMQVHVAKWFGRFHEECEGSDLYDPRVNVCYGVLVWKDHMAECLQVIECALRDYVGENENVVEGNRYVAEVYSNWLEGI